MGNEHLDATNEIYISYIYHKLPVIYIYIFHIITGGGGGTFCDVFELQLDYVYFKNSCTASKFLAHTCHILQNDIVPGSIQCWPTSETPLEWHFAHKPMVARF